MDINKSLKVEASKSFPVSAEQLFGAWTDPAQLKQWWKPMGNSLKEVTNDLKKGGTVRYTFENEQLIISGEYLEVDGKQKLIYTWNWDLPKDAIKNAEYKLTVEFNSKGSGSEIQVLQENFETEESMVPHREGWEKGLSELEQFLVKDSAAPVGQQSDTGDQPKESEGYREDPDQVKVGGG